MKTNQASLDRIIRVVLAIVLLYAGLGGVVTGALSIVAIVAGAILLLTGLVGWCPIYALLRIRTNRAS